MKRIITQFPLTVLFWILATASLLGADVRWIGAAQDVAQVDTITIGGDWSATSETLTVTCNNKSVIVTTGATMDTTSEVAAGLAEAINATSNSGLTADMAINNGGYEYGEFRDMVATVSGSVVTVTSATAGTPFTITVAETSAGTATHAAEATAATGKNHFDAAKNWSTGAVLSAGDNAIFDNGSIDVLWGLDNTTENISIKRTNAYQGNIGLKLTNTTHTGFPFAEYRETKLNLPITASTGSQVHVIGDQNAAEEATGYTFVDMGTNTGLLQNFRVLDCPASTTDTPYSVVIAGGNNCNFDVHRGSVSIGSDAFDSASEIASINMTGSELTNTQAQLLLGSKATTEASATINIDGGTLTTEEDATTTTATLDMRGGLVNLRSALTTANIRNGATLKRLSGNLTNVFVFNGGTFDATASGPSTVTNITLYRGFSLKENGNSTYTNGIDFVGCSPGSTGFEVPDSQTWTPSAL